MPNRYEIKDVENYAAQVIRVERLVELPGLDNLRGVPLFGYLALVSKETEVGSLMVAFVAETQLNPDFAAQMQLFRKPELNADPDPEKVGYLEHHGRVKAVKFRGHVSSALLLPVWLDDMTEGLRFDTINGIEISHKYVPPVKGSPTTPKSPKRDKVFGDVALQLKEHPDTAQYLREERSINEWTHVIVSQKIHGTSVRAMKVRIEREPTWLERFARWFKIPVDLTEWTWAVGSRKVIKSVAGSNKESSNHWYAEGDIWTRVMAEYENVIPNGMAIYGEIYGYVPGTSTPIQTNYTYDAKPGEAKFIAYRIVNGDYDLSDAAAREFCEARAIAFVPKLWEGAKLALDPSDWMDKRLNETAQKYFQETGEDDCFAGYPLPLSKGCPVDEGVVILVEGLTPKRYKLKSPLFFAYESKMLDQGEGDLE